MIMLIPNTKRVHFVGAGGIGMSGLLRLLHASGHAVSGSDAASSKVTEDLVASGLDVFIGEQDGSFLPDHVDLLVRTVAAEPGKNGEVDLAIERGIDVKTFPEVLGELTRNRKTIAVTGTHGKTTTSAMISKILLDAGFDPTILVGSRLPFLEGSNARLGEGEWMVIEADEYRRAFDHYWPRIAVVTNAEHDHPDAYSTPESMFEAYREFLSHVEDDGLIVLNADDAGTESVTSNLPETAAVLLASAKGSDRAALVPDDVSYDGGTTTFCVGKTPFELSVPGEHNVSNALQAVAVADELEIPRETSSAALASFEGTWRRFELRGNKDGSDIIDDYAHHPTEITATISAARQRYPDKRAVVVFQAHHRARLQEFLGAFGDALSLADDVILLPTYHVEGREEGLEDRIGDVREALERDGTLVSYAESFEDAVEIVLPKLDDDVVVLTLGAGDVTRVSEMILDA